MRRAAWVALLLAGCGGAPEGPPPPPPDEALGRAARAGRLALETERPVEASRLYTTALARARQRDDVAAIGDTAVGLAAAELARGRPAEALRMARDVRAELARRNAPAPPSLLLAEALALYRTGSAGDAQATAALVTARATEDADAAQRAWFLRGLIAADRGDAAAVDAARAALGAPSAPGFRADARELDAAAALGSGDTEAARRLAREAAQARRDGLDYRGLGRALVLEAEAAQRQGDDAVAADLLLRAGRGASSRGEWAQARQWLNRADALARRAGTPAIGAAARQALRDMAERERDA